MLPILMDLNTPMAEPDDSSKKSFLSFFGIGPKPAAKSGADSIESENSAAAAANLIDHARAFQSLSVADVMTPRVDIVAIELSSTLADVVRICIESEHSRLPIYRDGLDDPVGVVHIKDVLKLLAPEPGRAAPNWAEPVLHRLRRELLYVPSSMTTADLMLRMQAQRIHMALVIDEFGGTDGLVTLEDLIEAVVGNIDDEYDEAGDEEMRELPNGQYEIDGRVELVTLEEKLGLKLYPEESEEEIDTLAGLVAVLAGRVPQRGEVVPYADAGFDIEVLDADPRRIKRLRLHRRLPAPDVTSADD
ncbi:hemolysin family protein [Asticcacaulis taihuensis]|uniref:hemolysin family protein n=1 Tax=Asticcacaulis taihuensis TaxID=260084 RepID=UPI0026EA6295|nr:hemolysin family protein [Asticcacaulis taihuensis]